MSENKDSSGGDLRSVDFEIFGYVQGYAERKGLDLGLVGWVKNTSKGTVVGQVKGPQHLVTKMVWLQTMVNPPACGRPYYMTRGGGGSIP
uniref:acylphosphatase n=1 Tax=Electrophorus electricus TaxID=8005 RepID=A0A4W4DYA6_ELEEL